MTNTVPRAVVEAFYEAYAARDIDQRRCEFLDDDVTGPSAARSTCCRFCGPRHGKAAVLDMIGAADLRRSSICSASCPTPC